MGRRGGGKEEGRRRKGGGATNIGREKEGEEGRGAKPTKLPPLQLASSKGGAAVVREPEFWREGGSAVAAVGRRGVLEARGEEVEECDRETPALWFQSQEFWKQEEDSLN